MDKKDIKQIIQNDFIVKAPKGFSKSISKKLSDSKIEYTPLISPKIFAAMILGFIIFIAIVASLNQSTSNLTITFVDFIKQNVVLFLLPLTILSLKLIYDLIQYKKIAQH